jgi:wyosine [tRNA(Phe)-imidazoG37] synthetase (radical SAM superfamily)
MTDIAGASRTASSKRSIGQRKLRQVISSLSHNYYELSRCSSVSDVYEWMYYKFPAFFPLRDYPSVLNIEITSNCNFSCPHCTRDFLNERRKLGFTRLDVFTKVIKECTGRINSVKLIGLGEPALHPQLNTFMLILKYQNIKTLLYTNGTLFERFTPETICSWDVDQIVVSIDGTDARSFERLRLGGNFQQLYANLERFHGFRGRSGGASPRIEVRQVIMPNETPEASSDFTRFWRGRFADTVKYCFLGDTTTRVWRRNGAHPAATSAVRCTSATTGEHLCAVMEVIVSGTAHWLRRRSDKSGIPDG